MFLSAPVPERRQRVSWKRVCSIACLLLIGIATHLFAQDKPNFYAVIVGVSEFSNLPSDQWLKYADADARDFYKLITSPMGRAFPPENVFLLTNKEASHEALRKKLGDTLPKKVKPGDTVYLFVATHGTVEKQADKEAFLLAYDSDLEDLYSSSLPMDDLGKIMQKRLNAGRVFLFADACRSGKMGGSISRYIEDVSKQRGETMGLVASSPGESSREGEQFGGGHGVFSYFLLKGMMGAADTDGDKTVTTRELINYIRKNVDTATNGQQNIRESGDFEATTPISFVDKDGPKDLKISALPHFGGTEIASLQVVRSQSAETHAALVQAIRDGRLLNPPGNNAWDLYQRFSQMPIPDADKEEVRDDLVIAMASAGDKVLSAYRRGDQVVHLDAAKYEEGAQLFGHASQIDPDDSMLKSKAKFFSGRLLVEKHQYAEGISELREAISVDPNAAYPYNALGIAYMEQKKWNDAITSFQQASARAEKWVYPHYNLARAYAAMDRYRDAEREFKRGIEIGNDLGLKYAYLHYNLGILYLFQGQTTDAEEEFRRAIEMNPGDALSHYNLGLVLDKRGKPDQAEASYRRAAELDPRMAEPHLKLVEMYHNQKRPDLEEKELRNAVAADASNPVAAETLGRFLIAAKKMDEAEQVYMQMLTSRGDPAVALTGLGDVHAAQGKRDQAAEDYRQAISRSTDPKSTQNIEKKLRAVGGKK